MHLIVWVGFNHGLCLRLLSKYLLSVGFLSSPMERDSPRVFQSRTLCYCLCPKDLGELPLPEVLMLWAGSL